MWRSKRASRNVDGGAGVDRGSDKSDDVLGVGPRKLMREGGWEVAFSYGLRARVFGIGKMG